MALFTDKTSSLLANLGFSAWKTAVAFGMVGKVARRPLLLIVLSSCAEIRAINLRIIRVSLRSIKIRERRSLESFSFPY